MRSEFQAIVDEASRILGGPVTLEDREFTLVAFCAQHADAVDRIRQRTILERHSSDEVRELFEVFGIATSDAPVWIPAMVDHGVLPRWCLPARRGSTTWGYLWLLASEDSQASVLATDLERAMMLASQAGALLAEGTEERQSLGLKLRDLLSGGPEMAALAAEDIDARGLVHRRVPISVIEMRVSRDGIPLRWRLDRAQAPWPVLTWSQPGCMTLLVPLPDGDFAAATDMAQRMAAIVRQQTPDAQVTVGVGAPRDDVFDAHGSWQEAKLAVRIAQRAPTLGPIAVWPELGVHRLLGSGPQPALASALLDPSVRPLLEQHNAELAHTARVFLDAAGNVHRTAEILSVHRQTVYYRLEHIESLTGLDLDSGQDRLLLHLALTLYPYLHSAFPRLC